MSSQIILENSDELLLSGSFILRLGKSSGQNIIVLSKIVSNSSLIVKIGTSGLESLDFDIFILVYDGLAIELSDDIVVWEKTGLRWGQES